MGAKKEIFFRDLNGSIVSLDFNEYKKETQQKKEYSCGKCGSEKLFRINSVKTLIN